MGYTRDAVKGLGWIGLFRIGAKALVFFKIIVIYRYLSPSEVGIFGLCAIALGLLEMFTETGINIILVRDTKPITYYLDTAFIISLVRGLVISLLIFAAAFFAPDFFNEVGLFVPMLAVSAIPLIRGCINPAIAQFVRQLEYQKEARIRIFLLLLEMATAVLFVRLYPSALSLVFSMMVAAFAEVCISFLLVKPWPKMHFRWSVYHQIINPGKWINIAGLFSYIEQNIDNIIVGRLLGSTQLGFYQTGYNITRSTIAEVGIVFSQVATPIFARIKDDKKRLFSAYAKMMIAVSVIVGTSAIALNTHFVQEILFRFLSERWRPITPLIPYLSVAAFLLAFDSVSNTLFHVRNKLQTLAVLYGISLTGTTLLLLYFTPQSGIIGAAQAIMIAKILFQPLYLWKTKQAFEFRV